MSTPNLDRIVRDSLALAKTVALKSPFNDSSTAKKIEYIGYEYRTNVNFPMAVDVENAVIYINPEMLSEFAEEVASSTGISDLEKVLFVVSSLIALHELYHIVFRIDEWLEEGKKLRPDLSEDLIVQVANIAHDIICNEFAVGDLVAELSQYENPILLGVLVKTVKELLEKQDIVFIDSVAKFFAKLKQEVPECFSSIDTELIEKIAESGSDIISTAYNIYYYVLKKIKCPNTQHQIYTTDIASTGRSKQQQQASSSTQNKGQQQKGKSGRGGSEEENQQESREASKGGSKTEEKSEQSSGEENKGSSVTGEGAEGSKLQKEEGSTAVSGGSEEGTGLQKSEKRVASKPGEHMQSEMLQKSGGSQAQATSKGKMCSYRKPKVSEKVRGSISGTGLSKVSARKVEPLNSEEERKVIERYKPSEKELEEVLSKETAEVIDVFTEVLEYASESSEEYYEKKRATSLDLEGFIDEALSQYSDFSLWVYDAVAENIVRSFEELGLPSSVKLYGLEEEGEKPVVIWVIDASGSMPTSEIEAVLSVIKTTNEKYRVKQYFIAFSSNAVLVKVDSEDIDESIREAERAVRRVRGGGTVIESAMELVNRVLQEETSDKAYIILMSDFFFGDVNKRQVQLTEDTMVREKILYLLSTSGTRPAIEFKKIIEDSADEVKIYLVREFYGTEILVQEID